jgi:hypothetical protein
MSGFHGYGRGGLPKKRTRSGMYVGQHFFGSPFFGSFSFGEAKENEL